ncbi:hypothetical protein [Flavobacterium sp. JP2137]|uniref:hypothetical protein n=1 Tax=Flavobacterium sp. JP2137 TaxID=3414510 RepID=UPI003D2F9E5A
MGEFEIDKKARFFFFLMFFGPLIGLFTWIFWGDILDKRTVGEIYLSFKKEIHCIGKVDSIYRQKMNHNILALKTKSCVFDVASNWETKFEVGDSISKRKGELILKHYREGKLIEILDYNDIAKNMK